VNLAHDLTAPLLQNALELGVSVLAHLFFLMFHAHDDSDSFPPPTIPNLPLGPAIVLPDHYQGTPAAVPWDLPYES
jgi:hypothetical protein